MKMVGRFFGYVITVLAVLVLTYGYVYWGNLFGEKTPGGQMIAWLSAKDKKETEIFTNFSTSTTSRVESDVVSIASKEPEAIAEPVVEQITVAADNTAEEVVVEEAELQSVDQADADMNAEEPAAVLIVEDKQAVTGEVAPVETVLPESLPATNSQFESQPLTSDVVNANVAEAENMNELQKALFTRKLLMQARQAFHYRDYPTSIASYQQLVAQTQDNFDAYGELGNVYYYLGKNKEAAAAYYEAAAILIRLGKVERAASLMGVLSLLDISRARQLLDLLDAAR
jgi:tetratricopeptide (TPR) repeat protein